MSAAAPFARVVFDYRALVDVFRERSDQMQLTRLELDRLAGLADGHSGRLLSPTPGKHGRGFGVKSLGDVMQTLGLIIMVVEDPAARDRTLAKRQPFIASNRRVGNECNSKKLLPVENTPPAKVEAPELPPRNAPVSRAHLHVVQPRIKGVRWGGAL